MSRFSVAPAVPSIFSNSPWGPSPGIAILSRAYCSRSWDNRSCVVPPDDFFQVLHLSGCQHPEWSPLGLQGIASRESWVSPMPTTTLRKCGRMIICVVTGAGVGTAITDIVVTFVAIPTHLSILIVQYYNEGSGWVASDSVPRQDDSFDPANINNIMMW